MYGIIQQNEKGQSQNQPVQDWMQKISSLGSKKNADIFFFMFSSHHLILHGGQIVYSKGNFFFSGVGPSFSRGWGDPIAFSYGNQGFPFKKIFRGHCDPQVVDFGGHFQFERVTN